MRSIVVFFLFVVACVPGPLMPPPTGQWETPGPALTLLINPDVPDEYVRAIDEATHWWAQYIERVPELKWMPKDAFMAWFVYGSAFVEFPPRHVVVAHGKPARANAAATYGYYKGRKDGVLIMIPGLEQPFLTRVARHELGHALGLSDNPSGTEDLLMNPNNTAHGYKLLKAEIQVVQDLWGRP